MNSRIQNIDKEASTLFTKVVATARQQNNARTNLVRHVAIMQMTSAVHKQPCYSQVLRILFTESRGRIIQTDQHIDWRTTEEMNESKKKNNKYIMD